MNTHLQRAIDELGAVHLFHDWYAEWDDATHSWWANREHELTELGAALEAKEADAYSLWCAAHGGIQLRVPHDATMNRLRRALRRKLRRLGLLADRPQLAEGLGGKGVAPSVKTRKKLRLFAVEWDVAAETGSEVRPEELGLPDELVVEVDEDFSPGEEGADLLSDTFGWCVKSFRYEQL